MSSSGNEFTSDGHKLVVELTGFNFPMPPCAERVKCPHAMVVIADQFLSGIMSEQNLDAFVEALKKAKAPK